MWTGEKQACLRSDFPGTEPDRDPWAGGVLRVFSEERGSVEAEQQGSGLCEAVGSADDVGSAQVGVSNLPGELVSS